jgi:hypothetical protein
MVFNRIGQRSHLFVLMVASMIFFSSLPGTLTFSGANATTEFESIQFTPNNATVTEVQEPFSPQQEAIMNHLDMARQALIIGNLTMAIEELIVAIELQSGVSSEIGIDQNQTETRAELQTAPLPPT